jgi:hypothetical protein
MGYTWRWMNKFIQRQFFIQVQLACILAYLPSLCNRHPYDDWQLEEAMITA